MSILTLPVSAELLEPEKVELSPEDQAAYEAWLAQQDYLHLQYNY